MKVRTSFIISKPPSDVWKLLCNSKMDDYVPFIFRFCLPKPVECRLKSGVGGVGAQRQCVSNMGIINQRITVWEEDTKLCFEMMDTDIYFKKCVASIKESFELEKLAQEKTKITRKTEFKINGWLSLFKSVAIWVGLKNIHLYVFKNWNTIPTS